MRAAARASLAAPWSRQVVSHCVEEGADLAMPLRRGVHPPAFVQPCLRRFGRLPLEAAEDDFQALFEVEGVAVHRSGRNEQRVSRFAPMAPAVHVEGHAPAQDVHHLPVVGWVLALGPQGVERREAHGADAGEGGGGGGLGHNRQTSSESYPTRLRVARGFSCPTCSVAL